jgi:hypothetical protein
MEKNGPAPITPLIILIFDPYYPIIGLIAFQFFTVVGDVD